MGKNIACTVYNAKYQGGGYLIEQVNVDKPLERAVVRVPTLGGMRGQILAFYIEQSLKVLSENSLELMTFDCPPDVFKNRMTQHPYFKNWVYEQVDEAE